MKINNKIRVAASFNPTKKSHQLSIYDMCHKIDKDEITLPLYQRDLSWNLSKSVSLFNYQLFGKAPVAPISINQISDKKTLVPQISFVERDLIKEDLINAAHQSVVDGQQRLSTNYKAFIDHDDFRNIFLDVASAKFKVADSKVKDSYIPVGVLLNREQERLLDYLEERNLVSQLYPILLEVRSKIMTYNYTINVAENLTEDEQIEWFEVLNNAGSRVSALQMSFSKLKLYDFDIYTDYINPYKEQITNYGFEELLTPFSTNISYPVASLNPAFEVMMTSRNHKTNFAPIPSDTKENQITSLSLKYLNQITQLSLGGLENALEFLEQNSLEDKVTRMDYILYLAGYFVFNTDSTEENLGNLKAWVNKVSFGNKSNGERRKIFDNLIKNDFSEII
ncbi:GmrSD restriction endonuclease domain-containing protein [Staphylococcus arlettae]|uniref:GmrSD restriction endonuclease domain-containing protein n=1 Tax=Staphylococcus arlettae TaxID=29378 RepID=UPI000D1BA964|nr:DUF262 domain-containing protein [Staphylococcus arlettae]MCE4986431.1 DUF262 domain-containing protein [Staphylococcus arlettae]PTH65078.1 hypothetical protein BU595_07595 [Staphylococcus arlettae]